MRVFDRRELRRQDDDRRTLAEPLGVKFFDLDHEIETFFGTSIERLQKKFTDHPLLSQGRSEGPGSSPELSGQPGQRDSPAAEWIDGRIFGGRKEVHWNRRRTQRQVEHSGADHVLRQDSKPIDKSLTADEKRLYLREIKKDISYFREATNAPICRLTSRV